MVFSRVQFARTLVVAALVPIVFLLPAAAVAQQEPVPEEPQEGVVEIGGGSTIAFAPPTWEECISDSQLREVERRLADWYARPDRPVVPAPDATALYSFIPVGGGLFRDLWPSKYFDHDPGPGILDWDCGTRTYDPHKGTDVALRSFAEQDVGVPIYSVLDGVVIDAVDGYPDKNKSCVNYDANYVIVDHGLGRETWYWHMKTNSVAVSIGQQVVAGDQLGMVGSSGCSTGPHLHFVCRQDGTAVDPFTGPCNPGPSHWENQIPMNFTQYMSDFGLSETSPQGIQPPDPVPTSSHWAQTNDRIYMWVKLKNLVPNSTHQIRVKRPDGTVAFLGPVNSFNNSSFWNGAYWWWWLQLAEMKTIPGTWEIRLWVNGVVMIDAPVEVVPTSIPGFNRPPEPITATLEPVCPDPSDVLICRVDADLVKDDLDWDVLAFRYVWKVDGAVVRDVTTAGHKDVLPRDSWALGETVVCEVTPNDGTVDGSTVIATIDEPQSYCTAGVSANGCQATLSASGYASATATSGFDLTASGVEGDKSGIFFFGTNGRQAFPWGSGTSFQCVAPPVKRAGLLLGSGTPGACDGAFTQDLNALWCATCPKPFHNPGAGAVVQAQLWYRDPQNTSNQTTSLSDALEFSVCP